MQVDAGTFWLEPVYLIDANIPTEDVDAVLNSVTEAVSLAYGRYDQVAFISSPGIEQFRSLEGSRAGRQESVRRVPTSRVSFSIPKDPAVLDKAIAAIRLAHPYEEPVVNVRDGWASRARGEGDEDNPHRWWNRRKRQGS